MGKRVDLERVSRTSDKFPDKRKTYVDRHALQFYINVRDLKGKGW